MNRTIKKVLVLAILVLLVAFSTALGGFVCASMPNSSVNETIGQEIEVTFVHEHNFNSSVIKPTCTEDGYTKYVCEGCSASYIDDKVPALGHDIENHEAQEATCEAIGWDAYETCTRCDYTTYAEIPALGHDIETHEAKATTCEAIGWDAYETCSRCDYTTYEEIPAFGHDTVNHEAQAATCEAIGWEAYETCTRCDYTTYEEIPAFGHDTVNHEAKSATCEAIGWEAYETCSRCDYTTYAEIPALGHDTVNHEAQAATCEAIGWEAYETCTRCDYTTYAEIPALGHDKVNHDAQRATCEAIGWDAYETCSRCDYTTYAEISALGHDKVNHEAKAATCEAIGWEAYETCSRCDYTTYAEISALGHDIENHEAQEATCEAIGWEAYETCTRCDYTTYAEIPALGHDTVNHDAQEATCEAIGWEAYETCSRCDYTTYEEISALGHDIENHEAQEATCEAIGWEAYETCTRCDYTTYEEIPALGHDIENHEAQEATCEAIGWEAYETCSRCDYTNYAEIPALGHNYEASVIAPTCLEEGYTLHTCKNCDDKYKDTPVPALGHKFETNVINAACLSEGYTSHKCSVCAYEYRDGFVAPLGHSGGTATCTQKAVCTACGVTYGEVDSENHTNVVTDNAAEPTCTEKGKTQGSHCEDCKAVVSAQEDIPELGHKGGTATCTKKAVCTVCGEAYGEVDSENHTNVVTDNAAEPTCTEKGKTQGSHCEDCKAVVKAQEDIPELGHKGGTANCFELAVCERCQKKYGELDGDNHLKIIFDNAVEPTCTQSGKTQGSHCAWCKAVVVKQQEVPALGHSGGKATCTKKAVCTACDEAYGEVDKDNHTGVVTDKAVEPTCTAKGKEEGSHCEDCKAVIIPQKEIEKLSHKLNDSQMKATCEGIGYILHTCTVCGYYSYSDIVPALGHTGGKANCCEQAICSRCKEPYGEKDPDNHLKITTDKAVSATCTQTGKTQGSHCASCKAVIVPQAKIAKTKHTFDAWKTIVDPTCAYEGTQERVCTVCGSNETKSIAKLTTHSYKKTVTKATASKDGSISQKCIYCASTKSKTVIPKASNITLSKSSYTYDANAKKPAVTVKDSKGNVLTNGTDYTVTYSANKAIGTASAKVTFKGNYSGSKTLNFKILPSNVSGLKATQTISSVKLTWSKVNGAEGYTIYRYDLSKKQYVKVVDTTKTTYEVTKLSSGTTYKFAVKAYKKASGSTYYSASNAVISAATKPATPTLTANAGRYKADLSWKKVSGASGYYVYMATSQKGTYKQIATFTSGSNVSYSVSNLTRGQTYYFKIVAYKTVDGTKIKSAESAVKAVKVR